LPLNKGAFDTVTEVILLKQFNFLTFLNAIDMKNAFLILSFLPIFLFGQNLPTATDSTQLPYFVVKQDGKMIRANSVKYESSYYNGGYLQADNQQINMGEVSYYQDATGYFRNFSWGSGSRWYYRNEAGKINVYSRPNWILGAGMVSPNPMFFNNNSLNDPTVTGIWWNRPNDIRNFFFQVGDQAPQRFNYQNLIGIVGSNSESKKLLRQGWNRRTARTVLIVAGIGMTAIGASQGVCTGAECATVGSRGLGLALSGIGVSLSSLLVKNPTVKFREAVHVFNRTQ
jgi:hypothetical protein